MERGRETWSARGPMLAGLVAVLLLLAGGGAWGLTARIAGAVIAAGRLEVKQARQVVQHPDGGVVDRILVEEGDRVAAGDLLIRLDADAIRSELSVTEARFYEGLARRSRLAAERDGAARIEFDPQLRAEPAYRVRELMEGEDWLFGARRDSLLSEIEQLSKQREQIADQIIGIEAQRRAVRRQIELLSAELANNRSLLGKGLVRASHVSAQERELAVLTGRAGELTAGIAGARGRITETELRLIAIRRKRREEAIAELRDLQYDMTELSEARRVLRRQLDRLEIRAPTSGIVHDMQVFARRAVIRAAEPVLHIVPQDRPLVIAARVEPFHVDDVHVGQEVSLRFSALDQRTTPELYGQVAKLSADSLEDKTTGAHYYRAEIVLLGGEVGRLPEGVAMLPGMPVETFIRTADRTPIAFLTKPLADYFAKAFRES
ncbi:HlyD family type I secretion periplasmic adaptor subunit [Roseicyclus sp. F158]|uniref:Membrane fusion protein (MFP) family protein n=1 Tax=Tropicimonas omnivorans TaxID=3075590 RepID=A0ABU3DL08_9RHOB|nr:HlyD family type I secretion periplasmic adaptor subunit [Roseicyclus sp. F158]MDT0684401.1 HlyD family type I secretion periplasmic adaptor subunit [Roseicyclus sp. F158]